jgi:hypothetical protein
LIYIANKTHHFIKKIIEHMNKQFIKIIQFVKPIKITLLEKCILYKK